MKNINIQLPDSFDMSYKDIKIFFAAKLYEAGKLTLNQGAELAELKVADFVEMLYHFNVSLINYSTTDLK